MKVLCPSIRGRQRVWKALGTSHYSLAQARLTEFLTGHRNREAHIEPGDAKLTFREGAQQHLANLEDRTEISTQPVYYWKQIYRALLRSWPGLEFKVDPAHHGNRMRKLGEKLPTNRSTGEWQIQRAIKSAMEKWRKSSDSLSEPVSLIRLRSLHPTRRASLGM